MWLWSVVVYSLCCVLLCDPRDCSLPGSSTHGITQARILEWVAILFSRGSSQPRYWTCILCIAAWLFTTEIPGKPGCDMITFRMSFMFTMGSPREQRNQKKGNEVQPLSSGLTHLPLKNTERSGKEYWKIYQNHSTSGRKKVSRPQNTGGWSPGRKTWALKLLGPEGLSEHGTGLRVYVDLSVCRTSPRDAAAAAVNSVVSDSVRPHRQQPTRLPRPWDSPGKNTGVGCHFLLQCMKVKSENEVAQSCPTLSDPTDWSPPGSSVHGIFQARVLEWGAIAFSGAQAHAKRGGWTECLAPLSVDPRSPDFTRMALGPLTLHALVFKATWRLKPCVEITCDLNAL